MARLSRFSNVYCNDVRLDFRMESGSVGDFGYSSSRCLSNSVRIEFVLFFKSKIIFKCLNGFLANHLCFPHTIPKNIQKIKNHTHSS